MKLRRFVRKYLFWIVFFMSVVFNKGMHEVLRDLSIDLDYDSVFSFAFLMDFALRCVELIFISLTLLMCTEEDDDVKSANYVGYVCLVLVLMVMVVGDCC